MNGITRTEGFYPWEQNQRTRSSKKSKIINKASSTSTKSLNYKVGGNKQPKNRGNR